MLHETAEGEGSPATRRGPARGWTRAAGWVMVLLVGVFAACGDLATAPDGGARLTEDPYGYDPYGGGGGSTCGNGFSQAQCDAIQDALDNLKNSSDWECAHMGQEAQQRFDSGEFHYDGGTSDYGYMYEGSSQTYLGSSAFDPGELANTIAHEEAHHHGYEDTQDGGGTDAYAVGDRCAGSI